MVLGLTIPFPAGALVVLAGITMAVARAVHSGAPYTALAGFFFGFGLGLATGGVAAMRECARLSVAGGFCTGPDLAFVAVVAATPVALSAFAGLFGYRLRR